MQLVFGLAMIGDIAYLISNVPDHGSAIRQIPFLGPLEWRNLFRPKDKVSSYEKLVLGGGVRFLFLFVLMDVILLNLDLQLGPYIDKKFLGLGSISWGH